MRANKPSHLTLVVIFLSSFATLSISTATKSDASIDASSVYPGKLFLINSKLNLCYLQVRVSKRVIRRPKLLMWSTCLNTSTSRRTVNDDGWPIQPSVTHYDCTRSAYGIRYQRDV